MFAGLSLGEAELTWVASIQLGLLILLIVAAIRAAVRASQIADRQEEVLGRATAVLSGLEAYHDLMKVSRVEEMERMKKTEHLLEVAVSQKEEVKEAVNRLADSAHDNHEIPTVKWSPGDPERRKGNP